MGEPRKRAAAGGPTRRKVLATALAAGAGVASTRILGLRNLGTPAAAGALDPMDPMAPMAPMAQSAVMDPFIPDDSFFGSQDLDGSVPP